MLHTSILLVFCLQNKTKTRHSKQIKTNKRTNLSSKQEHSNQQERKRDREKNRDRVWVCGCVGVCVCIWESGCVYLTERERGDHLNSRHIIFFTNIKIIITPWVLYRQTFLFLFCCCCFCFCLFCFVFFFNMKHTPNSYTYIRPSFSKCIDLSMHYSNLSPLLFLLFFVAVFCLFVLFCLFVCLYVCFCFY